MFFRPRRSALAFCRSTATWSASHTNRVTAWRCRRNSDTAAESIGVGVAAGAKSATADVAAKPRQLRRSPRMSRREGRGPRL
ncbi:hypothetical protein PF005_g5486 [Phytophthora fragariae]|uniref:Uncharacterized protein n=1 Tax=Phytophthora fragariae TaxID=53985 RepID=A0A6A3LT47_9STRA|nr:hypothetical protein PF003_g22873 [Phytophthora fragariae]KAE8944318.1 hypothetical protein PF009_g6011 [Phytophthora fragariae]KAE9022446.1 hypothetical protein PF011_g4467 [Phytophthora fragariae]KAE9127634.1 hypothetical protein PF007_g5554 [Phytophthora fragariae]KAE9150970.1 hypothetical protein PF006_g4679 [Phytophthora fragariae]